MRALRSLSVQLALLLATLATATLVLGYFISVRALESALADRERQKLEDVAAVTTDRVAAESARLGALAEALKGRREFIDGLRESAAAADVLMLRRTLDGLFRRIGADILEVGDSTARVVHRAHRPTVSGDRPSVWGLEEALAGDDMLVTAKGPSGLAIRAIVPLRQGDRILGTLTVGRELGDAFARSLAGSDAADVSFATPDGVWASTLPPGERQLADPTGVRRSLETKQPHLLRDAAHQRARLFVPVRVVDESFLLVVGIDTSGSAALLERSKRELALRSLAILAVASLLGWVVARRVMRPLLQLQGRARELVRDLTGAAVPDTGGSEIAEVVHAVDVATGALEDHARMLTEARDAAEEASRAKSQFLANMSHEVRTPMNAILGLSELLLESSMDPQQQRRLQTLRASAVSLLGLLDDILDLSRIEAQGLAIEAVDFELRSLVEQAVDLVRDGAAAKGLLLETRIAPELPQWLQGDPLRLRQVLGNLLANAVKFTPAGRVDLVVAGDAHTLAPGGGPAVLCFEVRDTGIGIAAEALARIFAPFSQADESTTRRYGGSGLGLAIARELTALMGGSIEVESEPGKGSVFRVRFALQPGSPPPAASERAAATEMLQGRVLLVEDNPVNRLVAEAMLQAIGVVAVTAETGLKALQALDAEAFDAVLMDCQMPEMDGLEATRRIRGRSDGRARTPIVAVTAHAMAGDRERCLAAGMDDYIAKPIRSDVLRQVLGRWLPQAGVAAAGPGGSTTLASVPPP